MSMKVPEIKRLGRDWIIDRGPGKANPCCETKEDAEHLLRLSSWEKKFVRFFLHSQWTIGKVVNVGLAHGENGVRELLAVRADCATYWVELNELVEEVKE